MTRSHGEDQVGIPSRGLGFDVDRQYLARNPNTTKR